MNVPSIIRETDMPADRHEILEQRFNEHVSDYRKHLDEDIQRWEDLYKVTEANAQAVDKVVKSTQTLVNIQTTMSTIATLGSWLQKAAIVGFVVVYVYNNFKIS